MAGNAKQINMLAGLFKAFAHESITVSNTAVSLTSATYTTGGEKSK